MAALETETRTHGESQRSRLALAPALDGNQDAFELRVIAAEAAAASGDSVLVLELVGQGRPSPAHWPELAFRAHLLEASAEFDTGNVKQALDVLERARRLSEGTSFGDAERAEVLYQLGRCRLTLGSPANAASLLTLALDLCDRSLTGCDRLRTKILDWRSRCYQRERDWEAARADVDRALELAHDLGDAPTAGRVCFQASIVAERERQWLLARFYAEEARDIFRELRDSSSLCKVMNNLGGIHLLLGDEQSANDCLVEAVELASERGGVELGYALSSLAQLRLRTGDPERAVVAAEQALELLTGRLDHANEIGSAELILARALREQGLFAEAFAACTRAERVLDDLGSTSHSAAAWITRGDIARSSGDLGGAAELYRKAADALQDVHF